MYLPDTKPMALQIAHSNKQYNHLNSNDFREWSYTAGIYYHLINYLSPGRYFMIILRSNMLKGVSMLFLIQQYVFLAMQAVYGLEIFSYKKRYSHVLLR